MNEEKLRGEVQRMLRDIGFNDYHPPDISFTGANIGGVSMGRPDIYCLNTVGPSIIVEVKTIPELKIKEPWFDPSKISDKQRRWLDWWCFGRHGEAFLAIGTTWSPRALWVIHWAAWNHMENNVSILEGNYPNPPKRIPINAIEKAAPYSKALWQIGGGWKLEVDHSIMTIPVLKHDKKQWTTVSFRYEEEK